MSTLTPVPSEQTDLERMKDVFYRQRALVTETNHVSFAIDGFASSGGYQVKRWLIDATHNNTYGTCVAFGAPIAAPGQCGITAFAACRTTASGATVRCL